MNINEYSFSSLFGKHTAADGKQFEISEIEIPIIQRDYAQGRKSDAVSRVRERFLDTILDAVNDNRHLTLDFVYGEIETDKDTKYSKLTPLDGQQRLTTLFLLHWYASKKEDITVEDCAFLGKFTYYTRPSSRDFCLKLVGFSPDFKSVISKEIINQSWFQYQWLNDPTINGMLVMIDAIHDKFYTTTNLWHKLVVDQCVTFYFLPITEMGLTDELYIKMNSRGKPLTPFEHFKAEFEGMIREYDIALSNAINHKFDLDWTDMLFPYRGDNNIIDDEFMRYFFFVSDLLWYQQQDGLPERDEFKLAKILYGQDNPYSRDNLKFLMDSFDCWCGFDINAFFETTFSSRQYEHNKTKIYQDEVNIFKQCCDNYRQYVNRNRKFSLNNTLLLFAVVVYLQNKHDILKEDFQRRIRIIRNLIWNSQFEIRADGQRNNMPKLLAETREVILRGIIPQEGAYNQKQKEEERAKQKWLDQNPQYIDELFHLEDHDLLQGCIAVVGLDNPDNFKKFRVLFNNCERDLISRALLTFGDYSQKVGWRWQIGARNDSSWVDMFHPSNQREGFENTKECLNKLLYSLSEINNETLLGHVEDYLIKEDMPKDWKYYFVKLPVMLSETYGFYYSYPNEPYHILKMRTSERLSGWNWNVFTLALYYTLKEKYPLGTYAYQGDRLRLSDELSLDYLNDRIAIFKNDDLMKEYPISTAKLLQDEVEIDLEDRIVYGVQLVNQIVSELNAI